MRLAVPSRRFRRRPPEATGRRRVRGQKEWKFNALACVGGVVLGASVAVAQSLEMLAALVAITGGFFATALVAVRRPRAWTASQRDRVVGDVAYGCLLIAAILITFNGVRVAENVALADVFLIGTAVTLFLGALTGRSTPLVIPPWLVICGLALVVSGVVSASRSEAFGPNTLPALRFAAALAITPIVFGSLTQSPKRRKWIILAWLSSPAISALVAVLDGLGQANIGTSLTGLHFEGREIGLTSQPNHLGLTCAVGVPVALHLLQTHASGVPSRLAMVTVLPLLTAGVILSGSRAAVVAAFAGVLISFLMVRHSKGSKGAVFIPLVVVVAVSMLSLSATGSESPRLIQGRLQGDESTVASDADRKLAFDEGVRGFVDEPIFGQGFERARTAHNIYVQLLQAGGVLAFAIFSAFAVAVLRLGFRLDRSPSVSAESQALAGALTATMASWLIAGLVHNALYDRYLYVSLGLLLGLAGEVAMRARFESAGLGNDSLPGRAVGAGGVPTKLRTAQPPRQVRTGSGFVPSAHRARR